MNQEVRKLEICVDSIESAENAIDGGCHRLEVCAALSLGGLTPSPGKITVYQLQAFEGMAKVVESLLEKCGREVEWMVMIRPREGNFVYSENELSAMISDITSIADFCETAGFVIGILNKDNTLNEGFMHALMDSLETRANRIFTLHRAFDLVPNWKDAVDVAHRLGFKHILSSGQKQTAMEGKELLSEIVQYAREKGIEIIVGSGVSSDNVAELCTTTNAQWYHASASIPVTEDNVNAIRMGPLETNGHRVTSIEKVFAIREALEELSELE